MAGFKRPRKLGSFVFYGMWEACVFVDRTYTFGDEPIRGTFYLGGHVCVYIVKYAQGNIRQNFVKSMIPLRRFADFGGD